MKGSKYKDSFITLGIETSCDDTSVALVRNTKEVLSLVHFSQEEIHSLYGGVFPEMAARRHVDVVHKSVDNAIREASIKKEDINLIAASYGPGLVGSLLIGLNTAKTLSIAWEKPFLGINHVEAHIFSSMMFLEEEILFPSLGLVVSGGHSFVVEIETSGQYKLLATTQDDAIGEAFDKVAVLLGYNYPGGAKIEKLAEKGDPFAFPFKAAKIKNSPLDFSFSGLKTAVLYPLEHKKSWNAKEKAGLAASFQRAAFETVFQKLLLICKQKEYKNLFVGGGVSCNRYFQKNLQKQILIPTYFPPEELCQDNGVMIAALASEKFSKNPKPDPLSLEPSPRIPL